ncbi:DUF4160 domain-containing protein [Ectothiorhodospira shaposhnikovii]|uniref:DUF4160 domain-containing protein n=1 Tax=Ectothiorhodospira shaposhnikovii TaxID=1054 RepID=UPI0039A1FD76
MRASPAKAAGIKHRQGATIAARRRQEASSPVPDGRSVGSPCLHVYHGQQKATVDIRTCEIIEGNLPKWQTKMALAWAGLRLDGLMAGPLPRGAVILPKSPDSIEDRSLRSQANEARHADTD